MHVTEEKNNLIIYLPLDSWSMSTQIMKKQHSYPWPTMEYHSCMYARGMFFAHISVETRLKSESFKPLIGNLGFLVQNLWSKKLNLDEIT